MSKLHSCAGVLLSILSSLTSTPLRIDTLVLQVRTHLLQKVLMLCSRCNWPSGVERLPILTGAVNQFVSSKQMDDVVNSSLQRGEGLYFLEQELLKELKPDVIVTQDLCNVCSVDLQLVQKTVEQLSIKPNIVTLNPQKLSDVLKDIVRVGKAVGCQQQSEATVAALEERVLKAQEVAKGASKDHKSITVQQLNVVPELRLPLLYCIMQALPCFTIVLLPLT